MTLGCFRGQDSLFVLQSKKTNDRDEHMRLIVNCFESQLTVYAFSFYEFWVTRKKNLRISEELLNMNLEKLVCGVINI